MKLIAGLGNPGSKYEGTRHNVGFRVLAKLAGAYGDGSVKGRFRGETVDAVIDGERVLLLSPLTYMNLSGGSVQEAASFYKLEPVDILVVCDDFNLDLGKLRIRMKGSSGGQKGLESIIQQLGTQEFARLRIGIGAPPENWDVADYVLSKFNKQEQEEIELSIATAAKAAADWVRLGAAECMNRYN